MKAAEINELIKNCEDKGNISDGYHTLTEIYSHRNTLFISLCRTFEEEFPFGYDVWKTKVHADGTSYDGWFLLNMTVKETSQQISYHLPMDLWDECEFAETMDKAPRFDGHSSEDVLKRLREL